MSKKTLLEEKEWWIRERASDLLRMATELPHSLTKTIAKSKQNPNLYTETDSTYLIFILTRINNRSSRALGLIWNNAKLFCLFVLEFNSCEKKRNKIIIIKRERKTLLCFFYFTDIIIYHPWDQQYWLIKFLFLFGACQNFCFFPFFFSFFVSNKYKCGKIKCPCNCLGLFW